MAEQSELKVIVSGEDRLASVLRGAESNVIRTVGAISSAIATLSAIAFPITQAANLEREMANVAKTTGFTSQQIANLTRQLAEMSLRTDTSAVDLAKIAAAAGQQGLGREGVDGIRQFTESVARMASVLDLTAEDAGRSIGKIANIFNIPLREIENTVSAINQLSNNSTARANELINVLKRLGDAGGSLNFTQSLALSATALDLGATPEVAGTTLSKFISALKVRNEEFAKLLRKDRDVLAKEAAEDGFKVFTEVLNELNKLSLTEREKTITKLFGGGRINALANKSLQDQLRASPILSRNLAQAEAGQKSGTSAIKEQQTVLQTFNKQVEILSNSFKELGRSSGEKLLVPLTGYVAQLRQALQGQGVKDFVNAVVQAFGELAGVIVRVTQYIAGLNINWGNFVKVIEVFAVLKLLDALKRLAAALPSVSAGFTLLAGSSKAATAADAEGTIKQVSAWGALKASIDQAKASLDNYRNARSQAAAQDADLIAKEQAALNAAARERQLKKDADVKDKSSKVAANNLILAQAARDQTIANGDKAILDANAVGQQAIQNAQRVGNEKIAAAERAHQIRVAEIQAEFRGVRTNAEKATRDGILASEQAHYNRQIAALRAADARRVAQAEEFSRAILGVTAARAAAELEIEERNVAAKRALAQQAATTATAAQGALSLATGQTAASRQAAQAAATASAAQATQMSRLRGLVTGLASAFSLLGTAVSFAVKAIGPLFFWATALFTVLDAFGLIETLGKGFQKLTDAMGLTSEATRKETAEKKRLHEESIQQKKDLDDLIERYTKLKDAKTGLLSTETLGALELDINNAKTGQEFQTAATKFAGIIEGNQTEAAQTDKSLEDIPKKLDEVNKQIAAKRAELANQLKAFRDTATAPTGEVDLSGTQSNIDKLGEEILALQEKAKAFAPAVADALQKARPNIAKDAEAIRKLISGIFTDTSADIFLSTGPVIAAMQDRLTKLQNERKAAEDANANATTEEARKQGQATLAQIDEQINSQKGLIEGQMEDLRKLLKSMVQDPSLSDATKRSMGAIIEIMALGSKTITTYIGALQDLKNNSVGLIPNAGFLINPEFGQKPKQGTGTGIGADSDKEARRIIKAKADLEKAENAAQAARARQHNDELLDANQRFFDRGLISLQDYYANRERIETENLRAEQQRVELDIAVKQRERKESDLKQSDRIRIDAEIKSLEAQRDVIESKIRALPAQMENALDKEAKTFNEGVLSEKLDLIKVLGLDAATDALNLRLTLIASQIKDRLARLKSEMERGVPGIDQAFIENFRLGSFVKALEPSLQLIAERARLTGDAVTNATDRIALKQNQGKLTDLEAERLTNQARQVAAAAIKQQIEEQEQLRDAFLQSELVKLQVAGSEAEVAEAAIRQTEAWKEQENAIDSLKLKYEELSEVIDDTARRINESIEDGLTSALENFANGTERSLLRTVVNFGTDLARSINAILARELSQNFIKDFLGGGGTGGIGGLFSRLFKTGSIFGKPSDEVSAGSSLLDKDLLGRDAGHAMYVRLVDGQDAAANKATSGLFEKLFGKKGDAPLDVGDVPLPDFDPFAGESLKAEDFSEDVQSMLDDVNVAADGMLETAESLFGESGLESVVTPGLESFGSTVAESFTSLLGSLGTGIGDLAGSLASSLGDLLSGLLGSGGGGDSISWVSTLLSSFFHTGGIVGGAAFRAPVPAGVFANAVRYHSGGVVGLMPDEVPAILKRGEEVLTANDPRHRNNSGGSTFAPVNVQIVTPDAGSFSRSRDQVAAQIGTAMNRALRRNR